MYVFVRVDWCVCVSVYAPMNDNGEWVVDERVVESGRAWGRERV